MRESCIDCGNPLGEGALVEHGEKCLDCLGREGREQALIEALSDKEHEGWSHWMRYLFSTCDKAADGSLIIPAALVKRWQRQIDTSYAQLSEREKQSDRNEVAHILPLIHAFCQHQGSESEEAEHA